MQSGVIMRGWDRQKVLESPVPHHYVTSSVGLLTALLQEAFALFHPRVIFLCHNFLLFGNFRPPGVHHDLRVVEVNGQSLGSLSKVHGLHRI